MLKIYGLKRTTLIDYPGHIACIAFTYGCTLRCPFCHNPELVVEKAHQSQTITASELLSFLAKRKGKLEGVVFSGGEPLLLLPELRPVIVKIKKMGFLVKIDTNGTLPDALKVVLKEKLADYIAMDFKTTPLRYSSVQASPEQTKAVLHSLELLKRSKTDYEIRTTLVPGMHNKGVLEEMMPFVMNVPVYVLQNFEPNGTIDPEYSKKRPFSREEMKEFLKIAKNFNSSSSVRIPD